MEKAWLAGGFGLGGVIVGGLIQVILFWQKYRADARDKIREDLVRFSADVFLYLRLIRNIREAEDENRTRGVVEAVPEATRADVGNRYRAVVSSTHDLLGSTDAMLVKRAESFLREFADYADGHHKMSTGRGGPYPPPEPIQKSACQIREHRPSLRWPFANRPA